MNKNQLRQKVNLSIALSCIGLFIVFPFQHTFIGGLLFAALTAATIGGLADSFAVSAIFGQPLKIKWPMWLGTNIIARNRDRLINELVDMVEDELLSAEMITHQIKNYDAATMIVNYTKSEEGQKVVKELLQTLLADLVSVINPTALSLSLKRLINQGVKGSDIGTLCSQTIGWSVKHHYHQGLITAIAKQLQKMLKQPGITTFLHDFIATAIRSYEQNKKGRQFVNGIAGLNADDLTEKLLKIMDQKLQDIQQEDHEVREKVTSYLLNVERALVEDEQYREKVSTYVVNLVQGISGKALSTNNILHYLAKINDELATQQNQPQSKLQIWLDHKITEALEGFAKQNSVLERINEYIRQTLIGLVERNHNYIGKLVRNKLNEYDEVELIALVQEKTEKDLQYIRLNGTLVGSLIGMLLYLLQAGVGGILS